MKNRQQKVFDLFENENNVKIILFCPECEEELRSHTSDYMFCKKCNKAIPVTSAKNDVSIEYIFGTRVE